MLVLLDPNFDIFYCLVLILRYVIPAEKHNSFLVVSFNVDLIILLRLYSISHEWRHVVRVLSAVQRVEWVSQVRLSGYNEVWVV